MGAVCLQAAMIKILGRHQSFGPGIGIPRALAQGVHCNAKLYYAAYMALGSDATGCALFWSRRQRQEAFRNLRLV